MKINETAASWNRVKVLLRPASRCHRRFDLGHLRSVEIQEIWLHPIESWNRSIRSSNHRVLERSAAEAVLAGVLSPRVEFPRLTSFRIDTVSSLGACTHPPDWKVIETLVKPYLRMPNRWFKGLPEPPRALAADGHAGSLQDTCFTMFESLGHQKRGVFPSLRRDGSDSQACRVLGRSWSSEFAPKLFKRAPCRCHFLTLSCETPTSWAWWFANRVSFVIVMVGSPTAAVWAQPIRINNRFMQPINKLVPLIDRLMKAINTSMTLLNRLVQSISRFFYRITIRIAQVIMKIWQVTM